MLNLVWAVVGQALVDGLGVQIEHSLESVLWMGDMRQIPLPTRELSVAFFRKMYEAGNKMLFYRIG